MTTETVASVSLSMLSNHRKLAKIVIGACRTGSTRVERAVDMADGAIDGLCHQASSLITTVASKADSVENPWVSRYLKGVGAIMLPPVKLTSALSEALVARTERSDRVRGTKRRTAKKKSV